MSCGERPKKAISLPDTKADSKRQQTAMKIRNDQVTQLGGALKSTAGISCVSNKLSGALAGKGSVSNLEIILIIFANLSLFNRICKK